MSLGDRSGGHLPRLCKRNPRVYCVSVSFFLLSAALFCLILLWYGREAHTVSRMIRRVPIRVGVTGTRGKSSVTRLIAAALRGSGKTVVAKTTGSRPVLIHADGTEERIDRRGPATILEQKKLLALACREGAEAFVSEVMSVHPESQAVESSRILRINLCAVTNSRVDHVTEQGENRSDVARSLSLSVPPGGLVICPEGEDLPELREAARVRKASVRVSPKSLDVALRSELSRLGYLEFEENLSLALEVCKALGMDEREALRGMGAVVPDLGALRLWKWKEANDGPICVFVNAFAANDVESTCAVLESSLGVLKPGFRVVGILNLRGDRGERTLQWIRALREGSSDFSDRFSALYVVGVHAGVVRRKLEGRGIPCAVPSEKTPKELVERILSENSGDVCMVGLGNIAGFGTEFVEYCGERGCPYES